MLIIVVKRIFHRFRGDFVQTTIEGTISTWGNGRAVRIPKNFLDLVGLKDNDVVEIAIVGDTITIKPSTPKPKSLSELFSGYAGDYKCTEWDIGEPVGKEVF